MLGIEETLAALPGARDEGLHSTAETPTEEVRVGARGSAQRPNVSKHTLHTEIDTRGRCAPRPTQYRRQFPAHLPFHLEALPSQL